jgi:hypothetical protein
MCVWLLELVKKHGGKAFCCPLPDCPTARLGAVGERIDFRTPPDSKNSKHSIFHRLLDFLVLKTAFSSDY